MRNLSCQTVLLTLIALVVPLQGCADPTVLVTFELNSPDLADDTDVFITGSLPSLGKWNPGEAKMKSLGQHRWSLQIRTKPDYPIEYKYTLGSWGNEAADEHGVPLQNFVIRPTTDTIVQDQILFWTDGSSKDVSGQITGTVHYHRQLDFEGLLPRDVIVWLPPNYDTSDVRCPVLYMHDGQNLVDPRTSSFGVDWQIDETLTRLIATDKAKPVIVVGIYSSKQRGKDYLPGRQGAKYVDFVCNKLKPLIDRTYRTDPSREATAIGGSSAGGVCAFTMAWQRPDVFFGAICMSPSFRYERPDGSVSIDYLPTFVNSQRPDKTPYLYLDNGGVGLDAILQPGIDAMVAALKEKGLKPEADFAFRRFPEARHNEAAWAKRLPAVLKLLFGT